MLGFSSGANQTLGKNKTFRSLDIPHSRQAYIDIVDSRLPLKEYLKCILEENQPDIKPLIQNVGLSTALTVSDSGETRWKFERKRNEMNVRSNEKVNFKSEK